MKKRDLKKLALLGITGGIMMVSQSVQADLTEETGNLLAFNGCGGKHGCGNVADNYAPSHGCGGSSPSHSCGGSSGQSYSGSTPSHGCGGASPQTQYSAGCGGKHGCGGSVADNYSPSHSCGGRSSCGGSSGYSNYQTQSGCNGSSGYYPTQSSCGGSSGYSAPTQSGCGGKSSCRTSGGQTQGSCASASNNYYQPQQQTNQQSFNSRSGRSYTADAAVTEQPSAPAAGKTLTKDELRGQLTEQGKTIFDRLSPEGQALAIKLASQTCKGHNACKGQNSCKTDKNACAGQGGCQGQSDCSFKNKDQAVKVAALKMAEKRASLNNGSGR